MGVEPTTDSDPLGAYPYLLRRPVPAGGDARSASGAQPRSSSDSPFDYAAPSPEPPRPRGAEEGPASGDRRRPRGPADDAAPFDAEPVDAALFDAAPFDYAATDTRADGRPAALTWPRARQRARRAAGTPLAPVRLPLGEALGAVLADPLEARTDLPAFDTSAMDGWAVSGPGPWRIDRARSDDAWILAGRRNVEPLADGAAVRIATGAQVPPGATAVLRHEDGRVRDRSGAELLHDQGAAPLEQGRDIRPRGQECRSGEPLLPAGSTVTPAVLGLAAAAGCDVLAVYRRPTVELLVLGDELVESGLPGDGRTRDALSPLLPPWLRACGAEISSVRRIRDDLGQLRDALADSSADVVVSTGGTAAGPVDFLHRALAEIGAKLLVDGVLVRPGHPMLLAELPAVAGVGGASGSGARTRHLVGLPGNPLAAVAGAVTLAEPLLRALAGFPQPQPRPVPAAVALPGHTGDTRLLPVLLSERGALPLAFDGPAMLRGLALAEGLAVVPPGGVPAGARVEILEIATG